MTLDNEFTKVILAGKDKDTAICISSDSETDSVNYTYALGKEPEFHEVDDAIDTDDGRSTQVSEQVDQPEVNGFLDGDNTETTVTVPRSSSANDDTHTVPAEPSSTATATWLKSSFATKEPEISIVNKPSAVGTAIARRHQTAAHKRNFDSDAFDEMIYRQFQPKRGKAGRQSTAVDSTDLGERLHLPVNPAIHRPHNRSKEWRDDKMKEIKKRGNRKKWFGKAAERLRWLYEKEQTEQAQRHAQTNQTNMAASKRRDPQPRTNTRAVDFGDVREEALPEDVRSNPAWLKAAAWHREIHTGNLEKAHSMSRKRRLTWRQYMSLEQEAAKKWQEG
ncbi:hypothetical protein K4F52_006233 [Lecanicillium sp. MT-2017a]|nr:hypothetical protein K4F52_006233 [Lecanicillium sp. MT-2017a]